MIIPAVPYAKLVDDSGDVTTEWRIYFEQLSGQLRTSPLCTYEEMTFSQMSAIPAGKRNGRFVFTTDTNKVHIGAGDQFLLIETM
jgi:hypothetical protein